MDSFDEMWPRGPRLSKTGAFPIGTDAVLLSAFAGAIPAASVCDLGCGSGIIAVLLLWEDARKTAVGVEIDALSAETARRNIAENGLEARFSVVEGDLRQYKGLGMAGAFDLTVANPPYFPAGSGKASLSAPAARGETTCTLSDVCAAAAHFTRWGGRFAMVHKPERLSEAMCALTAAKLEPKRLRFVEARAGAAPSLALIEARRGGRPGLRIEPPLVLADESGRDSAEVRAIYHR